MARTNVLKTIDGVDCEFYWLPPQVAIKIATRLTKLILEPLSVAGAAMASGGKSSTLATVGAEAEAPAGGLLERAFPIDALAKAFAAMSSQLDEAIVWDTIQVVLNSTHVKMEGDNGTRRVVIDRDFTGRPGLMLKIAFAALEVNFSDFFGGNAALGALAAKARTAAGL